MVLIMNMFDQMNIVKYVEMDKLETKCIIHLILVEFIQREKLLNQKKI